MVGHLGWLEHQPKSRRKFVSLNFYPFITCCYTKYIGSILDKSQMYWAEAVIENNRNR